MVVRDQNSGCLSKIIGSLLIIFGFLACLTVLGIVIGIPMIIVGVIFFFAGRWAWIALFLLLAYIVVSRMQRPATPALTEASGPAVTLAPMPAAPTPSAPAAPTSSPTASASFDCARSSGDDEQLICASPRLASLDVAVANDYARLRQITQLADADQVRDLQRAWLVRRRGCHDEPCLLNLYVERTRELGMAVAVRSHVLSASLQTPGDCDSSRIDQIGLRLIGQPDSGAYVAFADGITQTGYDAVPEIAESHVGDAVTICLLSLPANCPPGDDRGRVYAVTNRRTGGYWQRADAQHGCGGA